MATNPNVLVDRNLYVGGSEISAILGISAFKTRYELLKEKAGLLESTFDGNEYTHYGDTLEPIIRTYINSKYGAMDEFLESTIIRKSKFENLIDDRCNYDGLNDNMVLEIKTTSVIHEKVEEYDYYLCQLLWGMILADKEMGILAIYNRPKDMNEEFDSSRLQVFFVSRDDYKELEDKIESEVRRFKIDLQMLKEDNSLVEEDFLPVELTSVGHELINLEEKLVDFKSLEKEVKEGREVLYNLMAKYNIKSYEDFDGNRITRVDGHEGEITKTTELDVEMLKEKYPEAYANCLREVEKKGRKVTNNVRVTLKDYK